MARSPAIAPGAGLPTKVPPAKPKTVIELQASEPVSSASSPQDSGDESPPEDLAERLNWEEQRKYIKGDKLGSGTYADVYKGYLRSDPSTIVAIKKIKVITEFKDGIAPAAFRECKYLNELSHPNIIHLLGVFSSKDQNINLVLEYLPQGDLEEIRRQKSTLRYGPADIKAWMAMVNRAVWWCHENHILHRDIKLNNIFVAADGTLKLADFGLARHMIDPEMAGTMTTNVITTWYRPPELFYEARTYSGKVDIWSVACVHAELLLGNPFLPGETSIQMLDLITKNFGHPTERTWPGVSKLPLWANTTGKEPHFQPARDKKWLAQNAWNTRDETEADLLYYMFQLDPQKRYSARQILEHPYWQAIPRPTKTENLPKKGGGEKKMGEDLKRKGGELGSENTTRVDKVARKLNFG